MDDNTINYGEGKFIVVIKKVEVCSLRESPTIWGKLLFVAEGDEQNNWYSADFTPIFE